MSIHSILLITHIIAGAFCLFIGLISFSAKKQKGIHTLIGEGYHLGYFIVFISSVGMAIINWTESAYLFYIAIFSYGLALFGYLARKLRWKNWLPKHIGAMAGSYIGIVTAVLVVNGMDIPLLNKIPVILLWFLPTIVGTPLIILTNQRFNKKQTM